MHVIGDQLKIKTWCPTCKGMLTFNFWGVDGNEEPMYRCWLCGTVMWLGSLVTGNNQEFSIDNSIVFGLQ